jgi:hypothetical protein
METTMSEEEVETKSSSKKRWLGGFLGGVLILAAIFIIKHFLGRGEDDDYGIDNATFEATGFGIPPTETS